MSKADTFLSICNSVKIIATRLLDGAAFNEARLSKIEDRLAALDRGDDATASARSAFDGVNADRVRAGKEPLWFKRP